MTPLLVAARTGNYILVELLLSNNATIDQGDDVRKVVHVHLVFPMDICICMFTRYNNVMDIIYYNYE